MDFIFIFYIFSFILYKTFSFRKLHFDQMYLCICTFKDKVGLIFLYFLAYFALYFSLD